MVRALVEKLPVMITPRWVISRAQPLAIEDLIEYLVAALRIEMGDSRVYEIGGADQVSYQEIMKEYSRQRGLRRALIRVPVLSPGLSSLWLGLVTPIYARVGRELIDSVRNETVVTDPRALEDFAVQPRGVREAIERAIANEDREFAETRWSDALSSGRRRRWGGSKYGTRIVDSRSASVSCRPRQAFRPIRRLGGGVGWYYADWLWRLRGFLDLLVGGVGSRRGRRHPEDLLPGETIDFWRVEAYEPDRLVRLGAEMRLPGRAWLQFEVSPDGEGSIITQTAIFDPRGMFGLLYWYTLYPLHQLVFRGMLRGIVRESSAEALRARTSSVSCAQL
jgi:hypothetical protein